MTDSRRTSLTARMADLLDRMAFACELGIGLASPEREYGNALSERETVEPSFRRYAEQARELVALHNARQQRRSDHG